MNYNILCGDNVESLKTLEDNSLERKRGSLE
jgi:hypothetical protein